MSQHRSQRWALVPEALFPVQAPQKEHIVASLRLCAPNILLCASQSSKFFHLYLIFFFTLVILYRSPRYQQPKVGPACHPLFLSLPSPLSFFLPHWSPLYSCHGELGGLHHMRGHTRVSAGITKLLDEHATHPSARRRERA